MRFPTSAPLHVLLVEQDDDIRDIYTMLFAEHGCVVSAVADAGTALAHAAAAPDIIFTSLVFKDMSGFELCRRLRAMPQTSGSMIVALTGYCESGIEQQVMDTGFDAYLLKPVSVYRLLALLDARQAAMSAAMSAACAMPPAQANGRASFA